MTSKWRTFQDPYLACGPKQMRPSVWPRFPFLHRVTSLSPGSASKKSISDKVVALFSEGMDWSAVWISLFIYCVGFFSFLLTPLLLPDFLFASQPIEEEADLWRGQLAWWPLRCRVGVRKCHTRSIVGWGDPCCLSHPPMRGILREKNWL